MELTSLKDLYVHELRDLFNAESQLVKALPKVAKKAHSDQLRRAIEKHLEETKHQKERLQKIFDRLGIKAGGETCEAMQGLIEESEEILKAKGDDDVRDAGIIAACQRVEHYEISGYGSARTFARTLGFEEDVKILEQSLEEEKSADKELNRIAMETINRRAAAE